MITILIIIGVLLVLYLLMIMPRMINKPEDSAIRNNIYYAHRGLHDNETDAPENSMAAFRKAVEAGYGIELDVQLTKDRIPVVFHDETLTRVCGVSGNVRDYTYEELQQFNLCNSKEKIPLFADFLKLIDGQIPLIIEIKIHENAATVCSIADELIREYQGAYCIESFDPRAVMWYKKNRQEVIRGQLSSDLSEPDKHETLAFKMVHYLMFNFLSKPDFISYGHLHKNNISRLLCRYLYRNLSIAWTIRSQNELDNCRKDFDLFIFEGFTPDET